MKVLLLGEFSSLHRYLKEGLKQLGHYTMLASEGDRWKKIGGADIQLYDNTRTGILARTAEQIFNAPKIAKQFRGYDVVQLIYPILYGKMVNDRIIKYIIRNNGLISLIAAGSDYRLTEAYKAGRFDYFICDYDDSILKKYGKGISGMAARKSCIFVQKNCDMIIPSCYEYKAGYEDDPKCREVIPFPINTDSIGYTENRPEGKIVIFHGLNRELSKGTPFIRTAVERLKENYPDDVEVIMDGHMPFERYVELMKKTNVVIDQCCTYSYGINACIAMAQGKVVLSGARREALDALGVSESPIFCIRPDPDQIYEQLEYILKNRNMIPQWGYESRKYVEDVHNYIKIAQRYVDTWRSTGK